MRRIKHEDTRNTYDIGNIQSISTNPMYLPLVEISRSRITSGTAINITSTCTIIRAKIHLLSAKSSETNIVFHAIKAARTAAKTISKANGKMNAKKLLE